MMPTQALFSTCRENEAFVLMPVEGIGAFDSLSYTEEAERLLNELRNSQLVHVIVDLERVDWFGTFLVEILLSLWRYVNANHGKMRLCNVSKSGREVLQVLRLDTMWPVDSLREDALHAINSSVDEIQGRLEEQNTLPDL
jgi:anti-anti-sigma factor